MKGIIIYESKHHGNTKKLVDAIAKKYGMETVNAVDNIEIDFSKYDLIGFASGIDFSRFYDNVTAYAEKLPYGKKVFFLYTCASNRKDFSEDIRQKAEACGAIPVGTYGCKGYNTYGPWKLIGGMNRKHPNLDEIQEAINFVGSLK